MTSRILCVDDEPDVLEAVRLHLLGNEDIELVTFEDPREALKSLEADQGEFALALVDIMMPGMTGIEFMAQFKTLSPRTVRVNMSSHADLDLVLNALSSNQIYDFIQKPLTREAFLSTINKALDHYRLRLERDALAKTLKEKNAQLEDWNHRLDEEVQRKTVELALRDSLMQHLSGCHHLEDPYEVIRTFLKATIDDSAQQIILGNSDQTWSIREKSEGFRVSESSVNALEHSVTSRCGPLTNEELRQWEQSLDLSANSLAWGEALQHRDGVVGLWMVVCPTLAQKEQEALSRFSALVGLLLYDELTLDSIGKLSEDLF